MQLISKNIFIVFVIVKLNACYCRANTPDKPHTSRLLKDIEVKFESIVEKNKSLVPGGKSRSKAISSPNDLKNSIRIRSKSQVLFEILIYFQCSFLDYR